MRTSKSVAPDNLRTLLQLPVIQFTTDQVAQMLGISRRCAHQAINFGVSLEKIRVAVNVKNSHSTDRTIYENPRWRRRWVTKPWS